MSKTKENIQPLATLYPWQADIVKMVDENEVTRTEEAYQGVPEYFVNKELSITVVMPRKSGHTFLASYLAFVRPTVLVYRDMSHLKEINAYFTPRDDSETISMYGVFYALNNPSVQRPSEDLIEMNKKFATNKLIVVDNFMRLPAQIKDYILGISQGPIVFLGH